MEQEYQELEFPFPDAPAVGTCIEVADGVKWLRMPLPFALNHINLWLIRDHYQAKDGWMIVDCGLHRPEVQQAWETIFAEHLDGLPVLRILVTHMHPDHMGLASWLSERWQVPVMTSLGEFMNAYMLWRGGPTTKAGESAADFFKTHGLNDEEILGQIRQRNEYYASLVPELPQSYIRLMDGDVITIGQHDWRVIIGYGHSPEHISLFCESLNVYISGDMLLPKISTNISVTETSPLLNPLSLYLQSLNRLVDLPADALVLPSHGYPFVGALARVGQQHEHHAKQLEHTLSACRQWITAAELVPILFKRSLDAHQWNFAMGEAIAHLNFLWHEGQVVRTVDPDIQLVRFLLP